MTSGVPIGVGYLGPDRPSWWLLSPQGRLLVADAAQGRPWAMTASTSSRRTRVNRPTFTQSSLVEPFPDSRLGDG